MSGPSRSASRRLAIVTLVTAVAAFPLGALASHDFADVPNTNAFHADISALAASGVTSGCGGGNYCPSLYVTREQMAAFLNRLGALAPGKTPVVNADRLDGLDSSDFHTANLMRYQVAAAARHTPDTSVGVGTFSSIAVRSDGNPVISHWDAGAGEFELFSCSTPSCAQGSGEVFVPDLGVYFSSVAIRANGNPIIAYKADASLWAFACSTPTCSAGNAHSLDANGDVGTNNSMAIGDDGNPIISYYDFTNSSLKVYACTSSDCSSGSVRTLDNAATLGSHSAIAIGDDGNPVIAYHDITNTSLKVYACAVPDCSSGTARTVDNSASVGQFAAIVIAETGNPLITYENSTADDLMLFACSTPTCSAGVARTLDSASSAAPTSGTSIALGLDGNPVIAYSELVPGGDALRIYVCGDATCTTGFSRRVDGGPDADEPSLAVAPDGSLVIVYASDDGLTVSIVPADSVGSPG